MTYRRRRRWATIDAVAHELKAFMATDGREATAARRLPTRAELNAAGRADLAAGVNQHGHIALSKLLGVEPNRFGTYRRKKSGGESSG